MSFSKGKAGLLCGAGSIIVPLESLLVLAQAELGFTRHQSLTTVSTDRGLVTMLEKRWVCAILFVFTVCMAGQTTHAQDFSVNSVSDNAEANVGDGVCSTGVTLANGTPECTLRAAIQEASARPGAHVITVPAGTYTLTNATPCPASSGGVHRHYCIAGNVSIVGAGANTTILDAGRQDRVIFISPNATAQISGVTIQNGHQIGGTFDGGGGGGIMNQGTLTLSVSVVQLSISDTFGGGVHSIGPLTVRRSSFLNNSGGQTGGGVYQEGSQSTIEDCVFTGNAAQNGGGLSNLSSVMDVTGSLFLGNTATNEGGGFSATSSTIRSTCTW